MSPLPAPNPQVISRRVAGETVLIHLERDVIYSLNDTGSRVWELLSEVEERQELEARLLEEFDVAAETLAADVAALLHELGSHGLVEARPAD